MNMQIESLFDAETIQDKVADLGRQIETDLGQADPWIISIVGGSVLFLADLIRAVEQPVRFDFIQVQYSASAYDGHVLEIHYPISLDVTNQNLIIIKDISASGVIETYLTSQFRDRGAENVRFATLIDLPDQRKTDFEPDYHLFTSDQEGIFVGYGLKYRGRHGNLPYIGLAEEEASDQS
jgi:hypoxanthine phosphoribosyltransferase